MYFEHKVIAFRKRYATRDEALRALADRLVDVGAVRETYPSAVLDREEVYPTGLDLGAVGVAIPHTDAEHVITPQLGFMSLDEPVLFNEMGTEDGHIGVSIIIMLALPKADEQVPMLQKLVAMFESGETIKNLMSAKSSEEIEAIFAKAGIK